jgi:hypothetical protein
VKQEQEEEESPLFFPDTRRRARTRTPSPLRRSRSPEWGGRLLAPRGW